MFCVATRILGMYNGAMTVTHTQDGDEMLTVSEAARVAYLSNDTIRRYANKGILPSFRTPAGHRRFKRSDVEALLKKEAA